MLDGATGVLQPAMVVGRVLTTPAIAASAAPAPSYFTGEVQNDQVAITYTVYNEQAGPETGVLLTTTLEPGVTMASASQEPDGSGQSLAWSLGTIAGYDSASVTVVVNLSSPSTLELDAGAHAYATLDAAAVSAATPAATLEPGDVADPSLLAPTIDAEVDNPFIQEEAAALGYSSQNIFDFLHNDIRYNAYDGSMRGALGTLWSSAGNALDVASLGVALLRASGIPAQYAQGTLGESQAQELILSMFPAGDQTIGYITSGTPVSDPANDPTLLGETESHYWIQFDTGSGMQDADPLVPGASLGQSFTTVTGTFTQVPASLEQTVELKLTAEITNTADSLFGLSGQSDSTVLDQTFDVVSLVGTSLSIGNLVTSTTLSAGPITSTTNTYTPYLIVGGSGFDPSSDQVITGTTYQETITDFPFGSQILTGLFLEFDVSIPGQAVETYTRTLADAIGPAARQNGGTIAASSTGTPLVSPLDLWTMSFDPGDYDPAAYLAYLPQLNALQTAFETYVSSLPTGPASSVSATVADESTEVLKNALLTLERTRLAVYEITSDTFTASMAQAADVVAYFDSPRIIIASSTTSTSASGASVLTISLDLRKDDIDVIVAPGNAQSVAIGFNYSRGLSDSEIEAATFNDVPQFSGGALTVTGPISTGAVFEAAQAQGIATATLAPGDTEALDALSIPANPKALISQALAAGNIVIVPVSLVTIDGEQTLAWYTVNPTTGQTTGVQEDGENGSIVEFVANQLLNPSSVTNQFAEGVFAGAAVGGLASAAKFIYGVALTAAANKLNDPTISYLVYVKNIMSVVNRLIFGDITTALIGKSPAFIAGFYVGFYASFVYSTDPPVNDELLDPDLHLLPPTPNLAQASVTVSHSAPAGSVAGSLELPAVQLTGQLSASWSSTSTSSYQATSLAAAAATVVNSSGQTVGSGSVSLASATPLSISLSGNDRFSVNGTGSLSFYGPAESSLGVSADWSTYTASVTGSVTINLTTGALLLNGQPLPAGTYTISTGAATLGGSGTSSSPDFSGSASITAAGATMGLGGGTGALSVGGKPLDPSQETTLDGYSGTVTVSAGGSGTDAVSLSGSATNILQVNASPAATTTNQNTPVLIMPSFVTNFADTYTLSATAPPGWTVTSESNGQLSITPAPGLQGGTYSIQLLAQSQTDSNLVAQSSIEVTVSPTQHGLSLDVTPDPVLSVGDNGANLPTAFRATMQNLGPTSDTYTLTISNVPSGFTTEQSSSTVTVPSGQSGILGVYLVPAAGQPLPAPGTQVSFTVTATSTTNSSITQSHTVSFTVPAIDAVTITAGPTQVSTLPGMGVTDTLTITNAGNVAENDITFSDNLSSGLTLTGLAPLTLAPGQSATETITLTPSASTPLNSSLQAAITATYGPTASPLTQSLTLPVSVVAPGVQPLATAALAAEQLDQVSLAVQLNDLAAALSSLIENPSSAVFKSQAVASLTAIIGLVAPDPNLATLETSLSADLGALENAATAALIQAAITNLGNDLDTLGTTLSDEAAHGFTFSFLNTNNQIGRPQAPTTYQLVLQNTGSQSTTYDLSVTGLPSGVTGSVSQSSITLAPGAVTPGTTGVPALIVTLTSTSATEISPFDFTVTATPEGATELAQTITGVFSVPQAIVQVTSVTTNPTFTNPGGQVDVTAQILNAVNMQQSALVSYTVTIAGGTVLFTSQPVATTLNVLRTLSSVDLGSFDTTGYALGSDTITVMVTDASGNPISGATGQGTILIGTPVTATLTTTPTALPSSGGTVTTTLQVASQTTYTAPLGLIGTTSLTNSSAVAVDGSDAYVGAAGQIDIVDVSNPTTPTYLSSFGSSDFPGLSVVGMQVYNSELVVLAQGTSSVSSQMLLVYSLATPTSPTLLGKTSLTFDGNNESYLVGFSISNNQVYTSSLWYRYTVASGAIFAQFGESLDIDISNPADPTVVSVIYNDPPDPSSTGYPDGTSNIWQTAAVNSNVLLLGTTTATGSTVSGVQGEVLVEDTSNPASPSLIETLAIPGMAVVTGISVQGDQAFVIGSSADWASGTSGLAGNVVVAFLNLSNPQSPTIISCQILNVPSIGITSVEYLGNNLYVTDSLAGANDGPELLVFDASVPQNVTVTPVTVTNNISFNGLVASGSLLFAADGSTLSIYNINGGQDTPVTAQVTIPANSGVIVVPGSFSVAPTATNTNPDGSETLVWDLAFSAGTTSKTITWQSAVASVPPGGSVTVAQDASVTFTTLPTSTSSVDLDSVVNANIQTYSGGTNYPLGGTTIDVGGVTFTLADYPGGGTGIVQTMPASQASPSVFNIPVDVDNPSVVYTLMNSAYGVYNNLDGTVEFFGTGGAYAIFYLVEGQNIRDHFNGIFNNTIAAGTPSIYFGGSSDRFDRQTFVLPASFAGQTLTDIRLSGFGDDPTGEPFLAAVTVATAPSSGGSATTLGLPDQIVAGDEIIGVDPATQAVVPGAAASYTVTLENPTSTAATYDLSVQGVPASWVSLASSVTVPAGGMTTVPLALTSSAGAAADDYGFSVTASDSAGATGSVHADLVLQGTPAAPDPNSYGVVATLTPSQLAVGQGTSVFSTVQVVNTGSTALTFTLAATGLPAGFSANFRDSTISVPAGVDGYQDVSLTLTAPAGTQPGVYPFTVTATSATGNASSTAAGDLVVLANGVGVTLSPSVGVPGTAFDAKVTNTGTVTDTFNLSLAGLGALVSSLGTNQVTLAPGASQVVPITTTSVSFALAGAEDLVVIAQSQSSAAVKAGATASLTVAARQGMIASFNLASQSLARPGVATYVLTVTNTGNTQDAYSLKIMGTTGPIAADVLGLDGSPTQSIPQFFVPPLSSVTFDVQIAISTAGSGTLTICVTSLSNPAIAAAPIATLAVPGPSTGPPPTAAAPELTKVQRFGYHMMPTTLVLTFDEALEAATADNVRNYVLRGPAGRRIRIRKAVYDSGTDTVTLHPVKHVSIHRKYSLILVGSGSNGIKSFQGVPLDGPHGNDVRTSITWRNLVLGNVSMRFLRRYHLLGKKTSRPAVDPNAHRPLVRSH